jgi:AcrR family transcriptional regulator
VATSTPDAKPVRRRPRRRGAETRRHIAEVAARLFVEHGYTGTSMQAIADAAGVHVQTIYLAFGNKPAVLSEAAAVLVAGEEEDAATPPEHRRWVRELFAEPDPRRQLALYARHMTAVAGRFQQLRTVIRGAALSDPELAAFWVHIEQGRWDGPGHIAPVLAAAGVLRPGLSAEQAADIIYGLTTPDIYENLVYHRGWSARHFERWLTDVLCTAVLEDTATQD